MSGLSDEIAKKANIRAGGTVASPAPPSVPLRNDNQDSLTEGRQLRIAAAGTVIEFCDTLFTQVSCQGGRYHRHGVPEAAFSAVGSYAWNRIMRWLRRKYEGATG